MSTTRPWSQRLKDALLVVVKHATKHTGVGIVCAVAYFDPYVSTLSSHKLILILRPSGNWGVDLQAGSEYGYKLLFVVLLAGLFAVFLQVCRSTPPPPLRSYSSCLCIDTSQSIGMCYRIGYVSIQSHYSIP